MPRHKKEMGRSLENTRELHGSDEGTVRASRRTSRSHRAGLGSDDPLVRGEAIHYFDCNPEELEFDDLSSILGLFEEDVAGRLGACKLITILLDRFPKRIDEVVSPAIAEVRARVKSDRSATVQDRMNGLLLRFAGLCEKLDSLENASFKSGLETSNKLEKLADEIDRSLERRRERFKKLIGELAGVSLGSLDANRNLVKTVNQLRAVLGVVFHLADEKEGRRVWIRLANPKGCPDGSFQAVTSRPRKALYTGDVFPNLEVHRDDS